ncbi:MAG: photosystem II stability/assembly factor-like uncharacterized protein [Saprospiraceae bacterium]|jgi:photosystem II stability/assembly factor-like uncharacterized protein
MTHCSKQNLLFTFISIALIFFASGIGNLSSAQELSKDQIGQLKFRHIGPIGNRIISVAGIPGDPMTYFVGAASGGIWKTEDGGLKWKPIFDDKNVHSIGSLTIAPSDKEVIYAGTGESSIRSNVSIGNGVWKSTDGGETWAHMGLDNSGRIGRIVVHPDDPDVAFAAVLGHGYAPQKERGIWKTKDGGNTWKQVLHVDDNTGASDIEFNPENPRILYAGMWQLEMKTWIRISGGPGGGLYKSIDGGETWNKLKSKGLPQKPVGKIALAVTPANPDRVYALIETGDGVLYNGEETESGELWRSDDRGKTWSLKSHDRNMGGRQAYYTHCEAAPDNADEIYFMASGFYTSKDGGASITAAARPDQPNWDHHAMWIDHLDPDRMIVVGDGGLSISQNRGASWMRVQLAVAQLYHVTTDNAVPYNVLTNRQDGPAMKGPSRSGTSGRRGGMISNGMWHDVGGGESGFATADPTNPDIVWSSASGRGPLGGIVTRYDEKTRQFRHAEVWPEQTTGYPASDVKYRFQWTFPLLISPHDNETVYVTSQHVHRTQNRGQTWEVISPDLSLNDKSMQGFSGGLTGDNINVEYGNVIYAFDESPVEKGVFWAGTNDGLVHVSQDGGATWDNVTDNIPNLPKYGVVRNIDASKWDAGKAYISIELHQVGDFKPYAYKTENFGKSWTKIVEGIPANQLNYIRNIKEDPVREGMLYLGTETALYVSYNDGDSWQPLMSNLPPAPMYWIDIQEQFNDLVIGTYGRGIWILDDLSSLQQVTEEIATSESHLFKPKNMIRFRPLTNIMQFFPEPHFGKDPEEGGAIDYWLAEANDSVKLHIVNASGDTVRTLKHKGTPGINRVMWDFKSDPSDEIVMHTKPLYADWMKLDDDRKRKSLVGEITVISPPGSYSIQGVIGNNSYTQSFELLKDPNSEGSEVDIAAQVNMLEELKSNMNDIAAMINKVEDLRRQVIDIESMLAPADKKKIKEDVKMIADKLVEFESNLTQLKATGHGQDMVRWPVKLAERIYYLASTVATADFAPADAHIEVHEILKERIIKYQTELENILKEDLTKFSEVLREHNLVPLMDTTRP